MPILFAMLSGGGKWAKNNVFTTPYMAPASAACLAVCNAVFGVVCSGCNFCSFMGLSFCNAALASLLFDSHRQIRNIRPNAKATFPNPANKMFSSDIFVLKINWYFIPWFYGHHIWTIWKCLVRRQSIQSHQS